MKISFISFLIGFIFVVSNDKKYQSNKKEVNKIEKKNLIKNNNYRNLNKNLTNESNKNNVSEDKKKNSTEGTLGGAKNSSVPTKKNITAIFNELLFETVTNNEHMILIGYDNYRVDTENNLTYFNMYIFISPSLSDTTPTPVNLYSYFTFSDSSKNGYDTITCTSLHRQGHLQTYQCLIARGDVVSFRVNKTMEVTGFGNITIPETAYATYQNNTGIYNFKTNNLKSLSESDTIFLNHTKIVSSSTNNFALRGNMTDTKYLNSNNIKLFLLNDGNGINATCNSVANTQTNTNCDLTCSLPSTVNSNLNMSFAFIGNNEFLIIDFDEGENSVVNNTENNNNRSNSYGRKKKGLSTGGIIAIIIPCIVALIAVTAAAFVFKGRTDAPIQPNVNMGNNTLGAVGSSTNVVTN